LAGSLCRLLAVIVWVVAGGFGSPLQDSKPPTAQSYEPAPSQQQAGKPAAGQTRPPFILKSERNLVLVPVVVRDAKGNLVDNLTQQDFRIFDNGKPQPITDFSVLRTGSPGTTPSPAAPGQPTPQPATSARRPTSAHFIAFYFDDLHMTADSTTPVRAAAEKFLTSSWRPGDYAGVFTATGQTALDFTSDISKVQQAVARIMARPHSTNEAECPDITPYQSYLISELQDQTAEYGAYVEAVDCNCPAEIGSDPNCLKFAHQVVQAAADQLWHYTKVQSEATLAQIGRIIQRMAKLPGDRTLAFVSPGLIIAPNDDALGRLVDLAVREQVTVNSLDARGLFDYPPLVHLSHLLEAQNDGTMTLLAKGLHSGDTLAQKVSMIHTEAIVADDPLSEIAQGTGGTFFHNSSDLASGFAEVTALTGVEYLLGFSPEDLKPNGTFHSLKVQIASAGKYQVQARKGYTAPTKAQEARENQPEPIETALYSGNSPQAFPIGVHTGSSKAADDRQTLTISIHVDIRNLDFQKQEGHFLDHLVFRTALLDPHEQYVTGNERNLNLDLDEKKYATLEHSGINAETQLTVPAGDYVLREVVAEKRTGRLSTLSQTIQLPQEQSAIKAMTDWTSADFMKAMPELKGLEPAEGQQELPILLEKVGENVEHFLEAFPGVISHEEITLERLDASGAVSDRDIQEFSYRVLSLPGKNDIGLEEYRTDAKDERDEPEPLVDGFVAGGFTSRLVHFHPLYQPDCTFRYLGRQLVDGRETDVVFFAQTPGKARVKESLRTEDESIPILVWGLAWIDPTSYQFLRLRTDLLPAEGNPNLKEATTEFQFAEIRFKDSSLVLRLPVEVTLTVDWGDQIFRNRHRYSDFKLSGLEPPGTTKTGPN
jgi:VWFA-related protein